MKQSYHGASNLGVTVSGNIIRKGILGEIPTYNSTTFIDAYSPTFNCNNSFEEYEKNYVNNLEKKIYNIGSENIACLIIETITGSSNPAVKPSSYLFHAINRICKKENILIILDEVMCGLGRCGKWFAYIDSGLEPDIVAVGKGLAAGYAPISAVLLNQRIFEATNCNSGSFVIGQTYNNFPISCFIASKVLSYIESEELIESSQEKGNILHKHLEESLRGLNIRRINNHGVFLGIEFHDFDNIDEPMNKSTDYCEKMQISGQKHGLYLYPCHGSIENRIGHSLLVAPPLTCTNKELIQCADLIAQAVYHYISQEHRIR